MKCEIIYKIHLQAVAPMDIWGQANPNVPYHTPDKYISNRRPKLSDKMKNPDNICKRFVVENRFAIVYIVLLLSQNPIFP